MNTLLYKNASLISHSLHTENQIASFPKYWNICHSSSEVPGHISIFADKPGRLTSTSCLKWYKVLQSLPTNITFPTTKSSNAWKAKMFLYQFNGELRNREEKLYLENFGAQGFCTVLYTLTSPLWYVPITWITLPHSNDNFFLGGVTCSHDYPNRSAVGVEWDTESWYQIGWVIWMLKTKSKFLPVRNVEGEPSPKRCSVVLSKRSQSPTARTPVPASWLKQANEICLHFSPAAR